MTLEPDAAPRGSIVRHVLPMALFLILTSAESSVAPRWYPWLYTAKVVAVGAALWTCRRAFPTFHSRGIGLAIVAGVAGTVLWWLTERWTQVSLLGGLLPASILVGSRAGFDPTVAIAEPAWRWMFIGIRLIGLSLIVPLLEELFWRGFLARYLVDARFERVPYGKFTFASFAIVTIAFAAVHPEFVAALLWGALVNLLLIQTRNLWAAIAMHAVTNALLGFAILATGRWELW